MDLTLPVNIRDAQGNLVAAITQGAAEGDYPTLTLHKGDILNVRNVQGGTVDSPNLDLGAGSDGSAGPRGNIVCNWDVGKAFSVYDGRKRRLFAVNPTDDRRVHSYVPHRFHAGAQVWRDGRWQSL